MYALLAVSLVSMIPVFLYGENGLDFALIWTYILLGLGVLSAVGMSIVNIGKNPGGAKRALIGLAAMAVVLLIAYFMSSSEPVVYAGGKKEYANSFGLVATDMGLYTAYFAMAAGLIIVIAGEIRNSLK